jgi:hypothetical protein
MPSTPTAGPKNSIEKAVRGVGVMYFETVDWATARTAWTPSHNGSRSVNLLVFRHVPRVLSF